MNSQISFIAERLQELHPLLELEIEKLENETSPVLKNRLEKAQTEILDLQSQLDDKIKAYLNLQEHFDEKENKLNKEVKKNKEELEKIKTIPETEKEKLDKELK